MGMCNLFRVDVLRLVARDPELQPVAAQPRAVHFRRNSGWLPRSLVDQEPSAWWRLNGWFVLTSASIVMLASVKATAAVDVLAVAVGMLLALLGMRRSLGAARSICAGLLVGVLIELSVAGSPPATLAKLSRYAHMATLDRSHKSNAVRETTFINGRVLPWLAWFCAAIVATMLTWRLIHTFRVRCTIVVSALCIVCTRSTGHGRSPVACCRWWPLTDCWTAYRRVSCSPAWRQTLCTSKTSWRQCSNESTDLGSSQSPQSPISAQKTRQHCRRNRDCASGVSNRGDSCVAHNAEPPLGHGHGGRRYQPDN